MEWRSSLSPGNEKNKIENCRVGNKLLRKYSFMQERSNFGWFSTESWKICRKNLGKFDFQAENPK